jgi:hypothetical protein
VLDMLYLQVRMEPCSGQKDVRFYLITPEHLAGESQQFVATTCSVYKACRLGTHAPFPPSGALPTGATLVVQPLDRAATEVPSANASMQCSAAATPRQVASEAGHAAAQPQETHAALQTAAQPGREAPGDAQLFEGGSASDGSRRRSAGRGNDSEGSEPLVVPFRVASASGPCYAAPPAAQHVRPLGVRQRGLGNAGQLQHVVATRSQPSRMPMPSLAAIPSKTDSALRDVWCAVGLPATCVAE